MFQNDRVCINRFSICVLIFVTLGACSSSDGIREAPSYALNAGNNSYSVNCVDGSQREILVRRTSVDVFYHPDGSQKTREEFCDESSSRPRTQR